MKNQLPVMPKFRAKSSGLEFNTLQEAAVSLGDVTLNRSYELFFKAVPKSVKNKYNVMANDFKDTLVVRRPTLFNEIEAVSPAIPPDMVGLFKRKVRKAPISIDTLAIDLVDRITTYIESNWDSTKTHVMPHSSGYDSRLISSILKRLSNKNGPNWLGELYLICWEPEITDFKKIMTHEEWGNECIVLVEGPPMDFYRSAILFDNVGRYCSDINRFLCYCFDYIIYNEIEKRNLNNVQIISGLFSDEILRKEASISRKDTIWNNLNHFMVHFLHDIHFEWSMYDTLLPFMSLNLIDGLLDCDLPKADDLKLAMINQIDPVLAALPNNRFEYFRTIQREGSHPYYRLSNRTVAEMTTSFRNSWYYSRFPNYNNFSNVLVNNSPLLKEYSKAAICEFLIIEGVDINGRKRRSILR